jgi:short-subunit dehydrogenase
MTERVVVITGGSSGIGAALAEQLAAGGDRVVLVARGAAALEAVAARCGPGRAHAVVADVSLLREADRVASQALRSLGRIDVWVNCAGRGITRKPSEVTEADVGEMMRANVLTAIHGTQAVLPHFRARGTGHLINVSSMLGRIPMVPFRSAYNGAKHFLNAWTASLRVELAESHPGIIVSLVSPGVVYTAFGSNALHGGPDSRQLPDGQSAAEVAGVIADLITHPRPDVYTRPGSAERVVEYFAGLGRDP